MKSTNQFKKSKRNQLHIEERLMVKSISISIATTIIAKKRKKKQQLNQLLIKNLSLISNQNKNNKNRYHSLQSNHNQQIIISHYQMSINLLEICKSVLKDVEENSHQRHWRGMQKYVRKYFSRKERNLMQGDRDKQMMIKNMVEKKMNIIKKLLKIKNQMQTQMPMPIRRMLRQNGSYKVSSLELFYKT